MSHATVGGASFTPFPHTFQTLNNILMIDCFFGDVGDCTQVCYSYGYLNGDNCRGAFGDS